MPLLEKMETVTAKVGAELLRMREMGRIEGQWHGPQLKTEADRVAHDMMSELLVDIGVNIPIVSEEDCISQCHIRTDSYWLIDPIDGTASFAEGYSGFVTQVALIRDSRPVHSAIFAPALKQMYVASVGRGATMNGQVISVAKEQSRKTLIDNYPEPRGDADFVYRRLGFSEYIECGSISLKICRVADGSADVFFKNVTIRDWDLAAPQLVLEEAGGFLRLITGENMDYDGSYDKPGMVAASTLDLCNEVISCFVSSR